MAKLFNILSVYWYFGKLTEKCQGKRKMVITDKARMAHGWLTDIMKKFRELSAGHLCAIGVLSV
jgi:transposase-like protein